MVIDDKIKQEMMSYYNERAEEYDKIYLGKEYAIIDPDVYKKDVIKVSEMVSRFVACQGSQKIISPLAFC